MTALAKYELKAQRQQFDRPARLTLAHGTLLQVLRAVIGTGLTTAALQRGLSVLGGPADLLGRANPLPQLTPGCAKTPKGRLRRGIVFYWHHGFQVGLP
jgi:hypothetical protein